MLTESHEVLDGALDGGLLLLCDHASNRVPDHLGTLGLSETDLARHIGYDIGVDALTRHLSSRFGAPAVLTRYTRLLIDPNRGEDDPTLIMRIADGAKIPGNSALTQVERSERIESYYRPYHDAVSDLIDRMIASGRPPVIVSVHSFTDNWKGTPRPWEVGILWDKDPRLAVPMIRALEADETLTVGDNEPYDGALKNDCLYKHGTARGLAHALIEVRQDLIGDQEGIAQWADRLGHVIDKVLDEPDLHTISHYGSRAD
ncbi:N-formylglutamate amidohydrolase [Coralliovum pocilloporae]|uniref:N-formylglutamate amidohydrolase n=1 Tax=Coralliovum pocilloporae TaxID=3066369 RepID=UPI003306F257